MVYHHVMPFSSPKLAPEEVKVVMNVRVTLGYRNQLVKEAAKRNLSLNGLLVHAVEREVPPK